jgi:hypothetical protein
MTEPRALDLQIDLLGPVIASAHEATSTMAETHDFIPGAMLLGVAASQLYRQLGSEERRIAFHGGGVSYGDANPVDDLGVPSRPMPFALHSGKGEEGWDLGRPVPGHVTNLAAPGARRNGVQWEQHRGNYVTADGRRLKVARQRSLKTAINPETRRAADAQLFGLEAIAPGQAFVARITFNGSVSEALEKQITEAYLGSEGAGQELRIGRSRGAEFGRVRVSRARSAAPSWEAATANGLHRLWVLSDIVVPPMPPDPDGTGAEHDTDALRLALGLEGELRPELSFLRWRAHQPFNAHWRARGMERVAITRGSVLTIEASEADAQRLTAAFGLDREAGFGRVAVDPQPLLAAKPRFPLEPPQSKSQEASDTADSRSDAGNPPPGVAKWIAARLTQRQKVDAEREAVDKIVDDLKGAYAVAARMGGGKTYQVGPSAQQWGAVRTVLERGDTKDHLFGKHGCAREADPDWGAHTGRDSTFSSHLVELVDAYGASKEERRLLIRAIRDIAEVVRSNVEVPS